MKPGKNGSTLLENGKHFRVQQRGGKPWHLAAVNGSRRIQSAFLNGAAPIC